MRAFVIVNPAAGGGRSAGLWPGLRDDLHRAGATIEYEVTSGAGVATRLAREASAGGWPLVIAVGGDGTVNEVVNGLLTTPTPAALGVLMTGRGCDTARNFRLPRDPRTAIEHLARAVETRVDVGVVDGHDGSRRYFLSAAGIGFDAEVAARTRASGGGATVYFRGVLAALWQHRPRSVTLADDSGVWTGDVTAVVAANGASYGGGMRIAPGADPRDGRLDVVILGALSRPELVMLLPTTYGGWHVRYPKISMRSTKQLRVDAAAVLPVHVDGEAGGTTPVRISVAPGALRVIGVEH
jgi:diacylglycerol kinase (ATP)